MHLAMSQTCLIYMNYSGQMCLNWECFEHTKFPLAEYASDHFGGHVCLAGGDHGDPLQSLLKAFFAFKSVGFENLLAIQKIPQKSMFLDRQHEHLLHPLYHTCKHGFYMTTKSLLETTKSWLEMPSSGPFHTTMEGECIAAAVSHGHLEVVKLLLENGAEGEPALRLAATHHHFEIVKLLLENGNDGGSALQQAVDWCDLEGTKFLLENGVNVNLEEDGKTALEYATSRGHVEVVRLLLDHGADINAQGGAALLQAVLHHHLEVVKLLLNHGAEVNVRGRDYCTTPLQLAIYHVEIIKLLLENGADVNAKGRFDETALQQAVSHGHWEVVKLLLDHGADVNAKEGKYGSALHLEVTWRLLSCCWTLEPM